MEEMDLFNHGRNNREDENLEEDISTEGCESAEKSVNIKTLLNSVNDILTGKNCYSYVLEDGNYSIELSLEGKDPLQNSDNLDDYNIMIRECRDFEDGYTESREIYYDKEEPHTQSVNHLLDCDKVFTVIEAISIITCKTYIFHSQGIPCAYITKGMRFNIDSSIAQESVPFITVDEYNKQESDRIAKLLEALNIAKGNLLDFLDYFYKGEEYTKIKGKSKFIKVLSESSVDNGTYTFIMNLLDRFGHEKTNEDREYCVKAIYKKIHGFVTERILDEYSFEDATHLVSGYTLELDVPDISKSDCCRKFYIENRLGRFKLTMKQDTNRGSDYYSLDIVEYTNPHSEEREFTGLNMKGTCQEILLSFIYNNLKEFEKAIGAMVRIEELNVFQN